MSNPRSVGVSRVQVIDGVLYWEELGGLVEMGEVPIPNDNTSDKSASAVPDTNDKESLPEEDINANANAPEGYCVVYKGGTQPKLSSEESL